MATTRTRMLLPIGHDKKQTLHLPRTPRQDPERADHPSNQDNCTHHPDSESDDREGDEE